MGRNAWKGMIVAILLSFFICEIFHEIREGPDTFYRKGIVQGSSEAAYGPVHFYPHHSVVLTNGKEFFFQFRAVHHEDNIHLTTIILCYRRPEEGQAIQVLISEYGT